MTLNHQKHANPLPPTLAALAGILLASCSSAPKRPAEVFTQRNAAIAQMELAHTAIMKQQSILAHRFLEEAWRLAVATDDAATRVQVLLSTGNAWYGEGAVDRAIETWTQARTEAEQANLGMLVAAANAHLARGNLAEGHSIQQMPAAERKRRAEESRNDILATQGQLKKNPLYTAFAWRVLALAEKELGNTTAAMEAIDRAVAIHESDQYLEDAAYDWYIKASILSRSGRYGEALKALDQALHLDRRAENAAGLGRDWMAMGAVQEKMGDSAAALASKTRGREILDAAAIPVQEADARPAP